MSARKPALPEITSELPPDVRAWIEAVNERIEVSAGERFQQDPRDRYPTVGELIDADVPNADRLENWGEERPGP